MTFDRKVENKTTPQKLVPEHIVKREENIFADLFLLLQASLGATIPTKIGGTIGILVGEVVARNKPTHQLWFAKVRSLISLEPSVSRTRRVVARALD